MKLRESVGELDFAEWSELAQEDPEAFEMRRNAVITDFIERSMPEHQRIGLALQHEIDFERARAQDAQSSFLMMARMMCAQAAFLSEGLNNLRETLESRAAPSLAKLLAAQQG